MSAFNGLFSPIQRSAADTLSGGFEERLKRSAQTIMPLFSLVLCRYEDYWKHRRRSSNRRLSKQGRSEVKTSVSYKSIYLFITRTKRSLIQMKTKD